MKKALSWNKQCVKDDYVTWDEEIFLNPVPGKLQAILEVTCLLVDFFAFLFFYLVQKGSPISEVKLQEETANREDPFCVCEFRLNHNEHILPSLFVCVFGVLFL